MPYVIALLVGIVAGAVCMFLCVMHWVAKVAARDKAAEAKAKSARDTTQAAQAKEAEVARAAADRQEQFDHLVRARTWELDARAAETNRLYEEAKRIQSDLQSRVISYRELQEENAILKRDLQNIDVNVHKLELDGEQRQQRQAEIDARSNQLAKRYLSETVKSVVASVGPNNFAACKTRLTDVIQRVRDIGFAVPAEEEARLLADLRTEFEKAVRADFERQEQARIKAQIREEERLKREIEREVKQLQRERIAVQAALDQALAEARGQFTEEVQRLQSRLAEAEEKAKRTMSMAQLTKAGHIYVISNVGTFGPGTYKVGMTRRLNPRERVIELGDASVPFPFDVHMMIHCDDAPALENALHRELHKKRVNKANPRKEFFRTEIEELVRLVREHHGEVQYVADAEAMEYRQSLSMSEEDAEFIEEVYEEVGEDAESMADDQ
jgi:hypothetical protein